MGKHNKLLEKRAEKQALAEFALAAEETLYHPPETDCEKSPDEVYLDEQHHLVVVTYAHLGKLVRFFIALKKTVDHEDDPVEQYSVCTLHGYLHEHTTGHQRPNDRRDIRPLHSQVDVQESFDGAYDMVFDRYLQATSEGSK